MPRVLNNYFHYRLQRRRIPQENNRNAVSFSIYSIPNKFNHSLRGISFMGNLTYKIIARLQH